MNQDLKSRIPVAVGYVLLIAAACLQGGIAILVLMIVFGCFCISEYRQQTLRASYLFILGFIGLSSLLYYFGLSGLLSHTLLVASALLSILFISANTLQLIVSKRSFLHLSPRHILLLLYIILPFLISVMMTVTQDGFNFILLGTFIIIWLNDAGAYFIGKAIGKHKLMPSVSPGKSIEGWIGGAVCGMLIAYVIYHVFGILYLYQWLSLSIIIWLAGSLGDLAESSWKRMIGIKDSGVLLKGHGGFLDRLDSFIYSISFVSLYFLLTT